MTLIAGVLLIVSAFLHASWNFTSKRRNPSLAFFFIAALSAAVIMAPLLLIYRHALRAIPPVVWLLVLATGVAQTVYFFGLAGAYKRGDMSLAYPLARALPVLLVAAITLGLGAHIGTWGLVGMALITLGCILLPHARFGAMRLRDYFTVVCLMAVIAAIGTTGYTLLDDQALRQLRAAPGIQLSNAAITALFVALQTASTALLLGLGTLLYRPERRQLAAITADRSLIVSGVVTGLVIMATYGLVLLAMAYVSNVSYVAAFRQLSIPIGAMLGLTLQHEPRFRPKLVGIGMVSAGLVLVGVG